MRLASWLPLMLLIAAAGAPGVAGADTWEHTYPVSGRPALRVQAKDAAIRVVTWDRPEIGMRIDTQRWHIGEHGVQIDVQQQGNRVELSVNQPHTWISFGFSERWIKIEIEVPHTCDLEMTTGDGSLNVASVTGRAVLHTGDGSITVDDLHGDVVLSSGDGAVSVTRFDGRLRARTGDGRIR